jgi:uncharacterized protein YaaQ
MKLVVAFIQDYDSDHLLRAVTSAGLSATKISSLGGFLRTRNSTILLGVEDSQVALCTKLLRESCRSRVEVKIDPTVSDYADWYAAGIQEVMIGGAVVFVINVGAFHRISVPAEASANVYRG